MVPRGYKSRRGRAGGTDIDAVSGCGFVLLKARVPKMLFHERCWATTAISGLCWRLIGRPCRAGGRRRGRGWRSCLSSLVLRRAASVSVVSMGASQRFDSIRTGQGESRSGGESVVAQLETPLKPLGPGEASGDGDGGEGWQVRAVPSS